MVGSPGSGLPHRVAVRWRVDASFVGSLLLLGACAGAEYRADEGHAKLVAPVAIGEGDTGKPERRSTTTASPPQETRASEDAVRTGSGSSTPDPAPLLSTAHFGLEFRYADGELSLLSVEPFETEKPMAAPRMMGRFAVELWIGKELIERVRFDFPLLAAEPPNQATPSDHAPLRLAPGADVRRRVAVPRSERATRAQLVDRATGEVYPLGWPPVASSLERAPVPAAATSEASEGAHGEPLKTPSSDAAEHPPSDSPKTVPPASPFQPLRHDAPPPTASPIQ